ncbi:hydantoinase/oxoprolinase N-terminal domain-containing protein [Methylovirgula sp. 4M-Z18]|uniref:hydantoinase/oxoprolinase N-terminal domain-containing protein n=1 Tax=Methylovirgula sp. 4M-Z18 TaxID=2293567 RepID=UPI0013148FBE|nr:hydantoinase/oxoprolinase family protein [Methylovirgula sp. 4M-Z18]
MHRYSIGIDTGGTYTDAAIIDAGAHQVVASAKALTTKGDLSAGVIEALTAVLKSNQVQVSGPDISLVSLSTTLATNAIVEGHGSEIAMIFIGFDAQMIERANVRGAVPSARILQIPGGHNHAGDEVAPLDREKIESFVRLHAHEVDAFAVAAQYSVRNPSHEHAARDIVRALTSCAVTLSSEIAQDLDAPRRALTAALNARIIGRIGALIAAVRNAMTQLRIVAPLMIVKGDGALASAEVIAERPIETILSGPAASVIGAKFLSNRRNFVMSDIGGTTTDVAILENGWPKLNRAGAVVGGRRTMVRAIDMRTFGLGGDTQADIDDQGRVDLGTNRIVPLALLGQRDPRVLDMLRAQLNERDHVPHAGRFALKPFGEIAPPKMGALSAREAEVYASIGDKPVALRDIIFSPAAHRALNRLAALGLVQIAGFTPSDAAHVLRLQSQWSREAALLGAALLLRWRRMTAVNETDEAPMLALAQDIVDAVVAKTGRVLIETLSARELALDDPFVQAVVSGSHRFANLKVSIAPAFPVVAVGGPAPVYYPEVGKRLHCEIVLPDHGDVANAVGAGVGVVRARIMLELTMPGPGIWRVHHDDKPATFAEPTEALDYAIDLATDLARSGARHSGAADPELDVHVDRVDIPGMDGDKGLIAATVFVESWGDPLTA